MILFSERKAFLGKLAVGLTVAFIFSSILWKLVPSFKYGAIPASLELRGDRFTLEVAVTEKEREKGLGGRESLCTSCAMLFVFEKPGRYAFWMKDMRFPIDIVWLLKDRVVFVAGEVSPDFSGLLDPVVAADQVVELNAGVAKNINVGEKIRFFK
ncbi:MAG: DUF192 domain-containing protein [Candidatus Moranbacteria bacterium]|nr:DUF192 domain-containing protein [Candidatus Moranbacteria bacterium]